MKPSGFCIEALKHLEGYSKLYTDAAGYQTAGYGHKYEAGDIIRELDLEQAEAQLKIDAGQKAEDLLPLFIRFSPTQCQFDALVLLVFNIGITAFASSTLLRALEAGEPDAARASWLQWDHVHGAVNEGLAKRRAFETALFFEESYT